MIWTEQMAEGKPRWKCTCNVCCSTFDDGDEVQESKFGLVHAGCADALDAATDVQADMPDEHMARWAFESLNS
uniref:Uncharacterized protein n=1 Tax=uncultured Caudovirales phage TaxID=2100421 RepID=A0A6J5L4Z1_9CAUD|nr:hypothetical protein UFOVP114_20 [uncultured Caudovirales phage]